MHPLHSRPTHIHTWQVDTCIKMGIGRRTERQRQGTCHGAKKRRDQGPALEGSGVIRLETAHKQGRSDLWWWRRQWRDEESASATTLPLPRPSTPPASPSVLRGAVVSLGGSSAAPQPLEASSSPLPAVMNSMSLDGKDFWIWGASEHARRDTFSGETERLLCGTLKRRQDGQVKGWLMHGRSDI